MEKGKRRVLGAVLCLLLGAGLFLGLGVAALRVSVLNPVWVDGRLDMRAGAELAAAEAEADLEGYLAAAGVPVGAVAAEVDAGAVELGWRRGLAQTLGGDMWGEGTPAFLDTFEAGVRAALQADGATLTAGGETALAGLVAAATQTVEAAMACPLAAPVGVLYRSFGGVRGQMYILAGLALAAACAVCLLRVWGAAEARVYMRSGLLGAGVALLLAALALVLRGGAAGSGLAAGYGGLAAPWLAGAGAVLLLCATGWAVAARLRRGRQKAD